jgi:outer membrane protein assembly factor BamA
MLNYFIDIRKVRNFIGFILLLLLVSGPFKTAFGQNNLPLNDTTKNEKDKKNFRFSILGGPGYTPDFGVLLGISTLFTFRMNASELDLQRSVIPSSFAVTFGNGIGFSVVSRPQLFFNQDRFRILGQIIFKRTGDNYYGVGFQTNQTIKRGEFTTRFLYTSYQFNPSFLFRMKKSDFFIGPVLNLAFDEIAEPSKGIQLDPFYLSQGGDSTGKSYFDSGLGVNVSYDTRDIPANAYNGIYLDFKAMFSPDLLENKLNYGNITFDYRQYVSLKKFGNRRVLAWTVNSKNSFGEIPLTKLSFVGSPFDLRGYYMGQYRDKSAHFVLTEYRHMFNTSQKGFWPKLANKLGFVGWAGVGFMGPEITDIEGVLPNYGAGLRIELQPRMNFRLDVGYSPLEKQTLIYFNMTESF